MKKLLFALFLALTSSTFAQQFGNEWIDYSQTYFKFKISENGVYRITFQNLLNAGFPVQTTNPKNLQLFAKGNEVPIYVLGESDAIFNSGDYIEFYAEKNDGWLDTALYKGRLNQPNPYYSLINDTISYFLTWNNKTNNLRIQEENAIDFGNYFVAPYILKENLQVYNSTYYDGKILSSQATNPEYTSAEGWMDAPLTKGAMANKFISTPNRYIGGPFVDFEIQVAGASDWGGVSNGDHHLKITFGSQIVHEIFEGYELKKINRSFSPTEIIKGNNLIRFESVDDRNAAVDRTALAYMKITYPHVSNLDNKTYYEFLLDDATSQSAQYLEIGQFSGGSNPILHDLTNHKKIKVVQTLSNYKMIVPNGNGRKKCVILNENEIKSINGIIPVNDRTGTFTDLAASASDSAFLIITHTSLLADASSYATYRQSKGKNSMLIDVEELYDQYAYGIYKHPLAIRNFVNQALTTFSYPPTHLFLIGKSISVKEHRKAATSTAARIAFNNNLVPSLGNPSADNLLIAGLQNTQLEVPIPIGRLSAKSPSEVDLYLDKMREYESAEPAKWMKRAIHFAGGKSVLETARHEGYLNGYAQDFGDPKYGGKTFTFKKSSSSPYQTTLADSVRGLINSGVSIMTFFGHSSATGGFDISIDSPEQLNNKGKYPVILGNSCFAGNYHQSGIESTSEDYVIQRDAGVIAFIANGNLGVGNYLNDYSSVFYENLTSDLYGKSLAQIMQQTVKDVQHTSMPELLKNVCIEMSLQGDPMVVMNAATLPDYEVKEDHVVIMPDEVTTDLNTFKLAIRIDNKGKANTDSVLVELTRKFPESTTSDTVIVRKISPVYFEQFVEFELEIDVLNSVGENKFTLLVDPLSQISELDESNNRVDFTVLIRSGEIIPVYPYPFSIVGQQSVTLSASTAFALEEVKSYVFELDQSIDFNSVNKISHSVMSSGGAISWQPAALTNMADSAVYYWRVSKTPAPGENFDWKTSSFQYLPLESGFAQDDFAQFNNNDFLFLKQNQNTQQFDFTNKASELGVVTYNTPSVSEYNFVSYRVDSDIREKQTCYPSPAFLIAVLDSLTLESWETPYAGLNLQNNFGQANKFEWCSGRSRPEAVFNFQVGDSVQMDSMKSFLNNKIPKGNFVVVYTWLGINYDAINARDSTILKAFENLGSTAIRSIQNGKAFIFTAKVGDLSSVVEKVGTSTQNRIEVSRKIETSAEFGNMTSVELGPSQSFNRFSYQIKSLEPNSSDQVEVSLLGINAKQEQTTLLQSTAFDLDSNITSLVDENLYERLQLKILAKDSLNASPPQLKRWQVSFTELPDAALSPNLHFSVNADSLEQGESFDLEMAVKNVSKVNMDSLTVTYSLMDSRSKLHPIKTEKLKPLIADSIIILKTSIPTQGLNGQNKLLIEVNPNGLQKEKFSFNNFAQVEFFVGSDRQNPLLDVTFDGRHILNREIVSSKPTIVINLDDNSQFLALDDTSAFKVYLRYPNNVEQLIGFANQPNLQFIPASLPKNQAQVIFTPDLKQDGIYQLRIQAKDKSGNNSGDKDYRVEFEVINQSTVTHMLNYPNPFSTSTRFVFTLTGSEIPDQIQIQIMTISGKIVKEIAQEELGPIQIGNNITEYAWDGRDEYGDQLANGVYLYRVKMKINGQNVEKRDTNIDFAFTKNFGKMYLLR